ncbi:MAG: serine/threonine-protein phosphatase [Clostridiales Family XIII bacterium]|jgi:serine/threonine protein phosphatase PrpC|nr:serine/threonine-protein phosphatase [Clostridiales Family XIII bacterium]
MDAILAGHTDVGIRKKVNQDSYLLKAAKVPNGFIILAAVCDGIGGLANGELASADVIKALSNWFDQELPNKVNNLDLKQVSARWSEILAERNVKISNFGNLSKDQLGTTCSVLLITPDDKYLIGHVGDSRIYKIDKDIGVLTNDHTVTAQAVRDGKMTEAQAKTAKGSNVLTQCVGASPNLKPEFTSGSTKSGELYMICSDGFRHVLTLGEIKSTLAPSSIRSEEELKTKLAGMIDICKKRGEKDNITAIGIRLI